jgi:hypothetical protein
MLKDTFSFSNLLFFQDVVKTKQFDAMLKNIRIAFYLLVHLIFEDAFFFLAIME